MPNTMGNLPLIISREATRVWNLASEKTVSEYNKIFKTVKSTGAYEEGGSLTGLGLAPVLNESAAVTYENLAQGAYERFTNVMYGLGTILSYQAAKNKIWARPLEAGIQSLRKSCEQTREYIGADIFNYGFDSVTYGDGTYLFSASHPGYGGGPTQSNLLSPASDLNENALETMVIAIKNITDEKGLRLNLQPRKLIISNSDVFNASRYFNTVARVGTAMNDINAIRYENAIPEGFQTWSYLDDQDAFYITTDSAQGLEYFEREPLELVTDKDFDNRNLKWAAYLWFCFGVWNWRCVYGSQGA